MRDNSAPEGATLSLFGNDPNNKMNGGDGDDDKKSDGDDVTQCSRGSRLL